MAVVEVPLELTVVPLSLTSSYPCHVVDSVAEISQIRTSCRSNNIKKFKKILVFIHDMALELNLMPTEIARAYNVHIYRF